MDLTFKWRKYNSCVSTGKVVLLATVPTAGFDIECSITPSFDGYSYNWLIYPRIFAADGGVLFMGQPLSKSRAFTEASDAIADVEKTLRREMAICHAMRPSMFAVWKDELARSMEPKSRGMKPWT